MSLFPVGTPVSQAIIADEDVKEIVRVVLNAVDSVHGDGDLPALPVKVSHSMAAEYAEANYYYDSLFNEALEIQVSDSAEVPELSFLHELAHFVDHKRLGFKPE